MAGPLQGIQQHGMTEHLWGLRAPEALPRHGFPDAPLASFHGRATRALQGIGHGCREDASDFIVGQFPQEFVQQSAREAGPGGVVHQHPVFAAHLGLHGAQAVGNALGATGAAATQRVQTGERRPVVPGPPGIFRREHHIYALDRGMPLEGADGVPDHGPAMDVQILLGMVGAHAGTHTGGGKECKMARHRLDFGSGQIGFYDLIARTS